MSIPAGYSSVVQLGVLPAIPRSTTSQASPLPSGLQLTPSSGTLNLTAPGAAGACGAASTVHSVTQPLSLTAASAGSYTLRIAMHTSGGQTLPPVDLDVHVSSG